MLLQSLYKFAAHTKGRHGETLLATPQFDSRYIPWLIDIKSDGTFKGFVPLMNDDAPGMLYNKLPRTLEPKDTGTVAEFLVEDVTTIFGLGDSPSKPMKERARQKHECFWRRIQDAAGELHDSNLQSILNWREKTLTDNTFINPVYEPYPKPGDRGKAKEQWVVVTPSGQKKPLYFKQNTSIDATFRIDGNIIVVLDEAILNWWKRWFDNWLSDKEKACRAAHGTGRVCVVSGEVDASISNSHLPKIKGVPNTTSFGATLASAESDSYHSYGLSIQQATIPGSKNAPDASYTNVSVRGAIAYCDSLNYLLKDEDHHFRIDPLAFCFWCKRSTQIPKQVNMLLGKAYPEQVESLLKSQFAGVEPTEVLHQERLYTLALSGNAGRVMVQQWIDQTLTEAIANLQKWWDDLQIVPLFIADGKKTTKRINESKKRSSPYAIWNLAEATVRRSKKRKVDRPVGDQVLQLYLAALKNRAPSLALLKPVLDEFHSALVKNDEKNPTYPFSQSRFALIKLVLMRNGENKKEGGFMPTYELADTPDPAYNLGRLLAVLENLQDKYHDYEKKGPGVVERYYAAASSAPASAFPILCRLARHHLAKVRREDGGAAYRIEERITGIMGKFQSDLPNDPPTFPRVLSLEQQGRFALGFYQQKAHGYASQPTKEKPTDQPNESL